jgi:hypothetical protein
MSHEHGRLTVRLPGIDLFAWVRDNADRWSERPLLLDTVHFDLAEGHVYLCWRLCLPHERGIHTAVIQSQEWE